MQYEKDLARKLRELFKELDYLIPLIEQTLLEARKAGMEIEVVDGTNSEVSHDLEGLAQCKLKLIKISARVPL